MPNLVITSTANSIKVEFNDQPYTDPNDGFTFDKGTWEKDEISSIKCNTNFIVVSTKDEIEWFLSDDGYSSSGVQTFTVDSVNGGTPSDLDDLYTTLIALIA